MKKNKNKPIYKKVRLPLLAKTGGAHEPAKGGKYRRGREKEKTRLEVEAELSR